MSILEDRKAYLDNPYFTKHEYGDFTAFYIVISICSIIGAILFTLNLIFCWCSPWRGYWQNRHTGNRWVQTIWVNTPHKNPPLDLTELESGLTTYTRHQEQIVQYHHREPDIQGIPQEYMGLQKRESDI